MSRNLVLAPLAVLVGTCGNTQSAVTQQSAEVSAPNDINYTADQPIYRDGWLLMPSGAVIRVLTQDMNASKDCPKVNTDSMTPELVRKTGAMLIGWSYVQGPKSFGYVTRIAEKSGIGTVFVAHYILRNCSISETRTGQRSFDGPNANADMNDDYNRLILNLIRGQ